jgi:serine/threonine protein kinase/WD40 repeat protein
MTLTPGTKLDGYAILGPLGAGGMGEVYRARDAALKRDVAIKVLPASVSLDPDRLRRFEQEAQSTAALNHPNIISIFHIGRFDGSPYIVTELLEGETLRDRLHHGPMRLREVLDFGVNLARGLAAAHDTGLIHRDLKPDNIFITKDSRLKILDFGLAKLDPDKSPNTDGSTVTLRQNTDTGYVMGTVGYMSPEQVRGLPTDARSDFFPVGAILYEMVTGQRAFKKATSADTMAAVLNEDPVAVSQFVPNVPPGLQRVIQRCLSKDPGQRFQHASDLAFALEAISDAPGTSVRTLVEEPRPSAKRKVMWVSLIAFVVLAFGFIAYWLTRPEVVPTVESITQITEDGKPKGVFNSLQTDGTRLYFNEGRRGDLQIAQVAVTGGPVSVIPTPLVDAQPGGVAPDGSFLAVLQGGAAPPGHPIWKVPLPTGEPIRLGNFKGQDVSVTPDGQILVSDEGNLFIANSDGGNVRKLISGMNGWVGNPAVSPDGRQVAFSFYTTKGVSIYAANIDGSDIHQVATHSDGFFCCPAWTLDSRYLLFETRAKVIQDIWYLPVRRSWWQRRVEPRKLAALPLSLHNATPNPRDGKTLFALGTKERGELVRYDLKTKQFAPLLGGISAKDVVYSWDGKWVAYLAFPELTLWRSRSDGSDRLQLSHSPVAEGIRFSPDGKSIAFNSGDPRNVSSVSLDGGEPTNLIKDHESWLVDWSPDGSTVVFATPGVINLMDLASGKRTFAPAQDGLWGTRWIGDDKLVAALATRTGFKLLDLATKTWSDWTIEPTPNAISRWGVSPDHQYLYYATSGADPQLMRVHIGKNRAEPVASLKDLHFAMFIQFNGADQWISFTPDGSPVFTRDTGSQEIYALTVNWP